MKSFCNPFSLGIVLTAALVIPASAQALPRKTLRGTAPPAAAYSRLTGALAETNRLDLKIGLPLRHQDVLTNLLKQLYEPGADNFHQWLTPGQFADRFGPTEDDYRKAIQFAETHGLKVTHTHSNRALLDVNGPVANIQEAFQVRLRVYQHPTEDRTFYAPDTEASVDPSVPILCVSGLDNFTLPYRLGGKINPVTPSTTQAVTPYATGSGPGGDFTGSNFRAAYVPGVTNTGTGQYIAVVDVGGPYYPLDIYMYETNAGLSTNTVVTNILLSGWSGIPSGTNDDDGEETLDIDMAMSMAPGATILNYEGEAHDVFNQIAIDNKAKQMTLSYGFGIDESIIQTFQQFAAQGQAMSQASGDGGADLNGGTGLTGNPYATIVGGTALTTSGANGPWQSETTWIGSGGGISGYGIPDWQQGVATSLNQGSATYRNYPDVAMLADTVIWWYYKNGQGAGVGGTSAASPLWTGFMALVNQQAASLGNPAVGFVNPAIYAIGKGSYTTYASCFHDITTGDNVNTHNPSKYYARVGYDLCTGWGTPTGSNTINALAGIGTNSFTMDASQGSLTIVCGGTATAVITVTRMNGLGGSVNLSVSGLPSGVSASLSSPSTTNMSVLTLTASGTAAFATNVITITGALGNSSRSIPLNVVVVAPMPRAARVSLSSAYNRSGFYTDGRTFSGGLDGSGFAYSANLLGSAPTWNGVVFPLGTANTVNAVSCAGQTITLPTGSFTTLLMLGNAVDGSQGSQAFTVTYTDNSTATFSQSFSDWAYPQTYSGEVVVASMAYRDSNGGTPDNYTAVSIYGYSFTLDQTKTVKSITLPNNSNVEIFAMALANAPASASLASCFNRAGMYTDTTTFTNPPTGGLDGGGNAYSATLLGNDYTWNGVEFDFGPANATNVISAAGQTLILPKGNYSALEMLATGVEGNQAGQTFTVTYADGSTSAFSQSLSDWHTPQSYAGETEAVTMGYRDSSNGTENSGTFYLYGYSFKLNSSKVTQSVQLPSDPNVEVLAMSLVPNWPPVFLSNPFSEPGIVAGQTYLVKMATNAIDLNGDTITFSKVSGPSWLTVSANGNLSGTPLSANVGLNSFVVGAVNPAGLSTNATLYVNVTAAPSILQSISLQSSGLLLTWTGGIAPYQVQMATTLSSPNWQNVGGTIGSNSLAVLPTNAAAFYRIVGQ